MKKISLPFDLLVAVAQLEDKEVAQVHRAIIKYADERIAPSFSNSTLRAFFSLFRSAIDEQLSADEKRSNVNRENAKGKKSSAKKKNASASSSSHKVVEPATIPTDIVTEDNDTNDSSYSQQIADTINDSSLVANEGSNTTANPSLADLEAIYPKVGFFHNETESAWNTLSDADRRNAFDYVPTYLSEHPDEYDQLYLNKYLKATPWRK